MNTEQREEMIQELEALEWWISPEGQKERCDGNPDPDCFALVAQFARQQLNLRVDGEKFMERFIDSNLISPQCVENDSHGIVVVWSSCAPEQLEALVLECLTTTPEEKE